jgi:hypothetical protein
MASDSPPSRARSADRLSSSKFIRRASGQSLAKEASIGTIECFKAWTSVMRMSSVWLPRRACQPTAPKQDDRGYAALMRAYAFTKLSNPPKIIRLLSNGGGDFESIIDLSRGSAITLALILSRWARDL